ncbi:hypothetical protein BC830DRAFT_194875 [Chytriomyces sp. MP71]|nr:hypothetical protein BC830DRAFT_194875 [Chytriomyces sp. MP71]
MPLGPQPSPAESPAPNRAVEGMQRKAVLGATAGADASNAKENGVHRAPLQVDNGGAGQRASLGIAMSTQAQLQQQQQEVVRLQKKRAANAAMARATEEAFATGEERKGTGLGLFSLFGGGAKDSSHPHATLPFSVASHDADSSHTLPPHPKPPLPEGWAEAATKDGRIYYVDHVSKITTWTDPRTLAPNSKFRAKDHNGNVQEIIYTGPSRNPHSQSSGSQSQSQSPQQQQQSALFEDPRKRAEERMMKRLRDMKGLSQP